MTRQQCVTSVLLSVLVVTVAVIVGCEAPIGRAPRADAPPPANAPLADAPQQYSYEHELRPDASMAMRMADARREYVVAVARVGDSGDVDSPFGDRKVVTRVGEINATVTAAGETTTVVVGVDDSLRSESIKPEPVPAGFTRRARRQIISELQKAGCFTLVERESINDIIRELEFGESRWAAKDAETAEGALAKVRYIVKGGLEVNTGAIFESLKPATPDNWVGTAGFPAEASDSPYLFRLRMYSVRTGIIVAVADGYGQGPREAIDNAVKALKSLVLRNHRGGDSVAGD